RPLLRQRLPALPLHLSRATPRAAVPRTVSPIAAVPCHPGDPGELFALSVAYAAAADRRDVAAFVAVFTADATLRVSAPGAPEDVQRTYRGTDQLAGVPERLGRYHRTFHVLGQAD